MSFFSPSTHHVLHKIHRWGGLILAFFILFYSITGILLNHRKAFNYFIIKDSFQQKVLPADISEINKFIDHYKNQINRSDDPKLIRIRNGQTIEFLYGSHGKTTYIIDPISGSMEVIQKQSSLPLFWLNALHKASQTSTLWIIITDFFSVLLIVITLASMIVMRYRPIDFALIATGISILIMGGLFA